MAKLVLGDLRWFPCLVFPEPGPEAEERLLELYRVSCRANGSRSLAVGFADLPAAVDSDDL